MVIMSCYGMFCGFTSNGFGGRFCGFTWDGVSMFKELFLVKIWCTIATHNVLEYAIAWKPHYCMARLQNCSLGHEIASVLAQLRSPYTPLSLQL